MCRSRRGCTLQKLTPHLSLGLFCCSFAGLVLVVMAPQGVLYPEYNPRTKTQLPGVQNSNTQLQGDQNANTQLQGDQNANTQLQGGQSSNTQLQGGQSSNTQLQGGQSSNTQLQGGQSSNKQLQGNQSSNTQLQGNQSSNTQLQGDQSSNTQLYGGQSSNKQLQGNQSSNTQLQGVQNSNTQLHNVQRSNTQLQGVHVNQSQDIQFHNTAYISQKPDEQRSGRPGVRISLDDLSVSSKGGFHQVGSEDIFLYSGFADYRYHYPVVRLLGMQGRQVSSQLVCRFSTSNSTQMLVQVPVQEIYPIYDKWPSTKLKYLAHDYTCAIPSDLDHGQARMKVGVGIKGSDEATDMSVTVVGKTHAQRQSLALCVKAIWGVVDPLRLIEWIEFNRILGVQKIVFYDSLALGPVLKVMRHYEQLGFVDVVSFTYVQKMALLSEDDPMRRQLSEMVTEQAYLVSMNDCYYRYRDAYKYVMLLDIDEVIVPLRDESLLDVVDAANGLFPAAAAFNFPTAWHLEEYGSSTSDNSTDKTHLHMQNFLYRSAVIKSQPKAIIDTDRAITVNWHGAVTMPSHHGLQGNIYLPWTRFGYVHHYRKHCKHQKSKCEELLQNRERDSVIPRYKQRVTESVLGITQKLNMMR